MRPLTVCQTNVLGQVADYLAVGIDPERSTIFAHSQVEALNQLLLPFLSLVTVSEVSQPDGKGRVRPQRGHVNERPDVYLPSPSSG